ncbi:hypothetical protein [Flavonifractor phage Chenonceau]|nr:hypothetical protein [Flavonifractor phage Chenonceau]
MDVNNERGHLILVPPSFLPIVCYFLFVFCLLPT